MAVSCSGPLKIILLVLFLAAGELTGLVLRHSRTTVRHGLRVHANSVHRKSHRWSRKLEDTPKPPKAKSLKQKEIPSKKHQPKTEKKVAEVDKKATKARATAVTTPSSNRTLLSYGHHDFDLISMALVLSMIFIIFSVKSGAGMLFSLPIFLALYSRIFGHHRMLYNKNPSRTLKQLKQIVDRKFFEKKKLSVVRFLRAHNLNRELILTENGLFGIARNYFDEQGTFKGEDWIKKLNMMTSLLWTSKDQISNILGIISG